MDTKNWKEFRVGDLFTPYLGGNPSSSKISDFGKYAIITASSDNNGISGYTDYYQEGLVFSNIITLGNRGSYNAFYHPYDVYLGNNVLALEEKVEMTKNQKLFITTLINKFHYDGYTNYPTKANIVEEILLLPAKDDKPDFEYMEEYIEEIKLKYVDRLEKDNNENIDKALRVTGLSYADLNKDLTVKPADRYEEFRVGDLFDKRTIKGVPKSDENLNFNNNGYHIFGQNIQYQYPQKILLDKKYLQILDKPIIAYTSSTAQIGFINENFYRTGDNGAFQGLFLKNNNVNINIILYLLTVLKKQFIGYGYDTPMGDIINLELLLPAIDENTPDFDYMEKAIYIYIAKKIKLEKLFNEKKIKLVRSII